MALAHRSTARQLPQQVASLEALHNEAVGTVYANIIAQMANALYPILITDESDPADQAEKRSQVAKAAHAAWMQFQASQLA